MIKKLKRAIITGYLNYNVSNVREEYIYVNTDKIEMVSVEKHCLNGFEFKVSMIRLVSGKELFVRETVEEIFGVDYNLLPRSNNNSSW